MVASTYTVAVFDGLCPKTMSFCPINQWNLIYLYQTNSKYVDDGFQNGIYTYLNVEIFSTVLEMTKAS